MLSVEIDNPANKSSGFTPCLSAINTFAHQSCMDFGKVDSTDRCVHKDGNCRVAARFMKQRSQ